MNTENKDTMSESQKKECDKIFNDITQKIAPYIFLSNNKTFISELRGAVKASLLALDAAEYISFMESVRVINNMVDISYKNDISNNSEIIIAYNDHTKTIRENLKNISLEVSEMKSALEKLGKIKSVTTQKKKTTATSSSSTNMII